MNQSTLSAVRVAIVLVILCGSYSVRAQGVNPSSTIGIEVTTIAVGSIVLDANTSYAFSTSNLSAALPGGTADTVLHVFDDVAHNRAPLGSNDDFAGLASQVLVTVPTTRAVHYLVHAYNDDRRGTATLTIRRGGTAGTIVRTAAVTFAGRRVSTGNLAQTTHVWTTELFDGPSDTVLLALNNGFAATPVVWDDDSGLDSHAYFRLPSSCTNCVLVVGRYNPGPEGASLVSWDGDAETIDTDGDGLGNSFEVAIGTQIFDLDSDDDGLDDAAEVIGIDGPGTPQKLVMWGANPTVPDVFLEVDWTNCSGCGTNPTTALRMTPVDANTLIDSLAPDIKLHIDIGVVNTATNHATWTRWGSWGGASMAPWNDICRAALSSARAGVFHHYHTTETGGRTPRVPADCAAGVGGRILMHEFAHQLGLDHGGNKGSGMRNGKPHYLSVVNYAYQNDVSVGFSPVAPRRRSSTGHLSMRPHPAFQPTWSRE